MKTMAARIHQKRIENDLTLEDVGNVLGVHKSTVQKWEQAEVQAIKRSYIAKMAELFHCSPAWLYGMEDSPEITLTYQAPDKEPVTVTVDQHPIIGETSLRVKVLQEAAKIKVENLEAAIDIIKSLQ